MSAVNAGNFCGGTKHRPIVLRGKLPRRALALVLEWTEEHRTELLEDWELSRLRVTPRSIDPLR
jgi:hypothetical protein